MSENIKNESNKLRMFCTSFVSLKFVHSHGYIANGTPDKGIKYLQNSDVFCFILAYTFQGRYIWCISTHLSGLNKANDTRSVALPTRHKHCNYIISMA